MNKPVINCRGAEETGTFSNVCERETLSYACEAVPLERAGVSLHLARLCVEGTEPGRHILLVHGVTYSSYEFDLDYADYSLARALARAGYAVWRLDIAGFGQSGAVADGFLPDSDYAAEDIRAAAETICARSGRDRLDVLGWSWGTVTVSRFAAKYPARVRRLVLYAPILSGLGEEEITEPFHRNSWEHAAGDFQRAADGSFDYDAADPLVIELFCSGAWHYDGEQSPNGGRRDICVERSRSLIELGRIAAPTLVICGDRDPYLDYARVYAALDELPAGSALEVIAGASHVAHLEKPCHWAFQQSVIRFLAG